MAEQSERNKFIYDEQDELEVFDFDELEVKQEPKKAIAASAILEFEIKTDSED